MKREEEKVKELKKNILESIDCKPVLENPSLSFYLHSKTTTSKTCRKLLCILKQEHQAWLSMAISIELMMWMLNVNIKQNKYLAILIKQQKTDYSNFVQIMILGKCLFIYRTLRTVSHSSNKRCDSLRTGFIGVLVLSICRLFPHYF